MLESVDYDHLPVLEKTKGIKIMTSPTSNQYVFRPNWLQPPFNNVKVRQAAAYALSQDGVPRGQYRRQALLPDLQGDVHLRLAARLDRRHGRTDRGQRRQGQGAADGGGLRRHAGRDAAADRPRRDQADRAGRQGAAREGGLQGRGPADGLAEHGGAARQQEGPAVGRRLERLRHELVAGRHPRSADDAQPDRDLREGALGLAVRRRASRSCATTTCGPSRRPRRRPRPMRCRSTPCRS